MLGLASEFNLFFPYRRIKGLEFHRGGLFYREELPEDYLKGILTHDRFRELMSLGEPAPCSASPGKVR